MTKLTKPFGISLRGDEGDNGLKGLRNTTIIPYNKSVDETLDTVQSNIIVGADINNPSLKREYLVGDMVYDTDNNVIVIKDVENGLVSFMCKLDIDYFRDYGISYRTVTRVNNERIPSFPFYRQQSTVSRSVTTEGAKTVYMFDNVVGENLLQDKSVIISDKQKNVINKYHTIHSNTLFSKNGVLMDAYMSSFANDESSATKVLTFHQTQKENVITGRSTGTSTSEPLTDIDIELVGDNVVLVNERQFLTDDSVMTFTDLNNPFLSVEWERVKSSNIGGNNNKFNLGPFLYTCPSKHGLEYGTYSADRVDHDDYAVLVLSNVVTKYVLNSGNNKGNQYLNKFLSKYKPSLNFDIIRMPTNNAISEDNVITLPMEEYDNSNISVMLRSGVERIDSPMESFNVSVSDFIADVPHQINLSLISNGFKQNVLCTPTTCKEIGLTPFDVDSIGIIKTMPLVNEYEIKHKFFTAVTNEFNENVYKEIDPSIFENVPAFGMKDVYVGISSFGDKGIKQTGYRGMIYEERESPSYHIDYFKCDPTRSVKNEKFGNYFKFTDTDIVGNWRPVNDCPSDPLYMYYPFGKFDASGGASIEEFSIIGKFDIFPQPYLVPGGGNGTEHKDITITLDTYLVNLNPSDDNSRVSNNTIEFKAKYEQLNLTCVNDPKTTMKFGDLTTTFEITHNLNEWVMTPDLKWQKQIAQSPNAKLGIEYLFSGCVRKEGDDKNGLLDIVWKNGGKDANDAYFNPYTHNANRLLNKIKVGVTRDKTVVNKTLFKLTNLQQNLSEVRSMVYKFTPLTSLSDNTSLNSTRTVLCEMEQVCDPKGGTIVVESLEGIPLNQTVNKAITYETNEEGFIAKYKAKITTNRQYDVLMEQGWFDHEMYADVKGVIQTMFPSTGTVGCINFSDFEKMQRGVLGLIVETNTKHQFDVKPTNIDKFGINKPVGTVNNISNTFYVYDGDSKIIYDKPSKSFVVNVLVKSLGVFTSPSSKLTFALHNLDDLNGLKDGELSGVKVHTSPIIYDSTAADITEKYVFGGNVEKVVDKTSGIEITNFTTSSTNAALRCKISFNLVGDIGDNHQSLYRVKDSQIYKSWKEVTDTTTLFSHINNVGEDGVIVGENEPNYSDLPITDPKVEGTTHKFLNTFQRVAVLECFNPKTSVTTVNNMVIKEDDIKYVNSEDIVAVVDGVEVITGMSITFNYNVPNVGTVSANGQDFARYYKLFVSTLRYVEEGVPSIPTVYKWTTPISLNGDSGTFRRNVSKSPILDGPIKECVYNSLPISGDVATHKGVVTINTTNVDFNTEKTEGSNCVYYTVELVPNVVDDKVVCPSVNMVKLSAVASPIAQYEWTVDVSGVVKNKVYNFPPRSYSVKCVKHTVFCGDGTTEINTSSTPITTEYKNVVSHKGTQWEYIVEYDSDLKISAGSGVTKIDVPLLTGNVTPIEQNIQALITKTPLIGKRTMFLRSNNTPTNTSTKILVGGVEQVVTKSAISFSKCVDNHTQLFLEGDVFNPIVVDNTVQPLLTFTKKVGTSFVDVVKFDKNMCSLYDISVSGNNTSFKTPNIVGGPKRDDQCVLAVSDLGNVIKFMRKSQCVVDIVCDEQHTTRDVNRLMKPNPPKGYYQKSEYEAGGNRVIYDDFEDVVKYTHRMDISIRMSVQDQWNDKDFVERLKGIITPYSSTTPSGQPSVSFEVVANNPSSYTGGIENVAIKSVTWNDSPEDVVIGSGSTSTKFKQLKCVVVLNFECTRLNQCANQGGSNESDNTTGVDGVIGMFKIVVDPSKIGYNKDGITFNGIKNDSVSNVYNVALNNKAHKWSIGIKERVNGFEYINSKNVVIDRTTSVHTTDNVMREKGYPCYEYVNNDVTEPVWTLLTGYNVHNEKGTKYYFARGYNPVYNAWGMTVDKSNGTPYHVLYIYDGIGIQGREITLESLLKRYVYNPDLSKLIPGINGHIGLNVEIDHIAADYYSDTKNPNRPPSDDGYDTSIDVSDPSSDNSNPKLNTSHKDVIYPDGGSGGGHYIDGIRFVYSIKVSNAAKGTNVPGWSVKPSDAFNALISNQVKLDLHSWFIRSYLPTSGGSSVNHIFRVTGGGVGTVNQKGRPYTFSLTDLKGVDNTTFEFDKSYTYINDYSLRSYPEYVSYNRADYKDVWFINESARCSTNFCGISIPAVYKDELNKKFSSKRVFKSQEKLFPIYKSGDYEHPTPLPKTSADGIVDGTDQLERIELVTLSNYLSININIKRGFGDTVPTSPIVPTPIGAEPNIN